MYYFITVADEKNVSKAADKLFISQPFLSKNIMKIESVLNTSLFERSRSGFVLTPDGRTVYENWKKVITLYADGIANLSSPKKLYLGILNIFDPLSFIKKYFTSDFSKISIKVDDLYQLYAKFKRSEYDAVITQEPFLPYITSEFKKELLLSVPMKIICRKDSPLAFNNKLFRNDLDGHAATLYCSNLNDFVSSEDTNRYYFDDIGVKPSEYIYTDNFANALVSVSLNGGFCFCDSVFADENNLPGDLIMKTIEDFDAKYYLCYHKEFEKDIKKLVNSKTL